MATTRANQSDNPIVNAIRSFLNPLKNSRVNKKNKDKKTKKFLTEKAAELKVKIDDVNTKTEVVSTILILNEIDIILGPPKANISKSNDLNSLITELNDFIENTNQELALKKFLYEMMLVLSLFALNKVGGLGCEYKILLATILYFNIVYGDKISAHFNEMTQSTKVENAVVADDQQFILKPR